MSSSRDINVESVLSEVTFETQELDNKMLRFVIDFNLVSETVFKYTWVRFLKSYPGLTTMTAQELKIHYHCEVVPRLNRYSCLRENERIYIKNHLPKNYDVEKYRNILENNEPKLGVDYFQFDNAVPNPPRRKDTAEDIAKLLESDNDDDSDDDSNNFQFTVALAKPQIKKKEEKEPLPEDFSQLIKSLVLINGETEISEEEALNRLMDKDFKMERTPSDVCVIFKMAENPDNFLKMVDRCNPVLPNPPVANTQLASQHSPGFAYSSTAKKASSDADQEFKEKMAAFNRRFAGTRARPRPRRMRSSQKPSSESSENSNIKDEK